MRARKTIATLAATALLTFGVAACGGDDSAEESQSAGTEVSIKTFMYDPDPVEVEQGTTVTFTNEDDILHTVTEGTKSDPAKGGFDVQLDGAGTTGDVTFDEAGTIKYTCTIHDGMDGEAIVR